MGKIKLKTYPYCAERNVSHALHRNDFLENEMFEESIVPGENFHPMMNDHASKIDHTLMKDIVKKGIYMHDVISTYLKVAWIIVLNWMRVMVQRRDFQLLELLPQ